MYNKNKYKNVITEIDGIKFRSKKEAKRFLNLKLLQKEGKIKFFLRQPFFDLPGNVKYVSDFLVVWTDGSITIEDVKGMKTNIYILKKKLVEAIYPITITEI